MMPAPNPSFQTPVWRLVGPFTEPGVLRLHKGRLALTVEVAGRPNLVALYCTLALTALGVLFIALAPTGTRLLGLTSRQTIWVVVGLGMLAYVIFALEGASAPVHTQRSFDVPVAEVRDLVFPWYCMGGGMKLTVGIGVRSTLYIMDR